MKRCGIYRGMTSGMGNIKSSRGIELICCIIFIFILSANFSFSQNIAQKHILILNSYHKGFKWTDGIEEGIVKTLNSNDENYAIHMEYMDTKRIHDEEYFKKIYELYEYKFKNSQFDLIISTDDDALKFLLEYKERLFDDIPVVFCGVNDFKESMFIGNNDFTGVVEKVDVKDTLDISLKLHPNTKYIVAVLDKSFNGIKYKKEIEKLEKVYEQREFIFLEEENISDIKDRIKNLPQSSIIFFSGVFKNDAGGIISEKNSIEMILRECRIPLYSSWEMWLGKGIIGGKITSAYRQGKGAAQKAIRILEGKRIKDIPIMKESLNEYIFDYEEMKRFGIKLSDLPENSRIIKKPSSVYSIEKEIVYNILMLIIIVLVMITIILSRNISKRKKAEEKIRESEERYRKLLELLPDGIITCEEKYIEFVNKAALRLVGAKEKDEIIGKNLMEFVHQDHKEIVINRVRQGKEEEITLPPLNEKIVTIQGKTIDVEVTATPFLDNGRTKRMVVIRDLSERKKAEILQRKIQEAEEQDKLKTEFFANLSHELRTPLNVIFSSIQLLELDLKNAFASYDGKNIRKRIKVLKQNSYRLLRLVDNLIDITKMDSGYFELEMQNYNIINIVEEITLSVAEYIEQKQINLQFDTDIEEKIIACDPDKIERIILNLLSNAVKFTDSEGSIFVNMLDKGEYIEIIVRDTGIGIPKDKLEIIFERFRQVDKSLRRSHEGSGIGLSLVESLVKMHGGDIHVESEYGKGTRFIIKLPVNIIDKGKHNMIKSNISQPHAERINVEFSDIYA
jgi:PAS domain S-box-containing protein